MPDLGTMLLVEDDRVDVESTQRAIRIYRVEERLTVVRDGAETVKSKFGIGVETDRKVTPPPASIRSDLQLPKHPELVPRRCIRSDSRIAQLPLVILTSCQERRDPIGGIARARDSLEREQLHSDEFHGPG